MKHSFEAVSLLTTSKGMLEVTVIPALNQPDWIIPSSLILSVDAYDEHILTYLWQQQEVAVFHLVPDDQQVDTIIVLEGNTVAHRLALQTAGEIRQMQVRISDVEDAELPDVYRQQAQSNSAAIHSSEEGSQHQQSASDGFNDTELEVTANRFRENVVTSYMFQTVMIDNVHYLVPDLDKIAHQLVDLDS
ncbi:hypothetical protein [Psychrobacter coccoides]|nr:hypothetical protein [Psychrobacter coccoides]